MSTLIQVSADSSLKVGTTPITLGTIGRVLFQGTGNVLQQSTNLFWDNTNSRLGIGTATPSALLHTVGSVTASGAIARGNYMQPTLVAAANNDVTVGLDITPTFTNGAFTGVTNLALRATGQVRFNANGEVSSFQGYGTDILRIISNNNGQLEIGQNLATPIITPLAKTNIYNRNNTYNALSICVTDGQLGNGSKIRWNNGINIGGSIYHSDAVLYDMGLQNQAGHYLHMFANGNVLLTNGTRTDAGYKLDVNGTARISGAITCGEVNLTGSQLFTNKTTAPNSYLFSASTITILNGNNIRLSGGPVCVNESGANATASSVLDVSSTTKGFLPPRMTTTQKNAIASPAAGLVVYDTTLNKLCVYTTAWETITSV